MAYLQLSAVATSNGVAAISANVGARRRSLSASIVALVVLSSTAYGQAVPFDFSSIPGLAAEPKVQIDLNPTMLGFVSEAARATNPASADALEGIRGIRVYVYEIGDDARAVLDFIENASGALEAQGWERAVYINEQTDKVRVYVQSNDTQISSFTVMVADGNGEAVFVSVAGTIDPAVLGQIAGNPGMGGVLGALSGPDTGAAGRGSGPNRSNEE